MNATTEPEDLYTAYKKQISYLVDVVIERRMRGAEGEVEIDGTLVEPDKRKRAKTMRELVNLACLKKTPKNEWFRINFAVVAGTVGLTPPQFPLNSYQEDQILKGYKTPGSQWGNLTRATQLYLLNAVLDKQEPHDFEFFWLGRDDVITPWKLGTDLPKAHWSQTLYASDGAMRTHWNARSHKYRVDDLLTDSVFWGLEKLAKLDADAANAFMNIGSGFWRSFNADPSTWGVEATERLDVALAKLTKAQAQVDAARLVIDTLKTYGGSDNLNDGFARFGRDLRVKCEERIDKEKT